MTKTPRFTIQYFFPAEPEKLTCEVAALVATEGIDGVLALYVYRTRRKANDGGWQIVYAANQDDYPTWDAAILAAHRTAFDQAVRDATLHEVA